MERPLLRLPDHRLTGRDVNLDAAVGRPAFGRIVRGDRLGIGLALDFEEAVRGDSFRLQIVANGLRTFERNTLVDRERPRAVGMAENGHVRIGILQQADGELVKRSLRRSVERRSVGREENA